MGSSSERPPLWRGALFALMLLSAALWLPSRTLPAQPQLSASAVQASSPRALQDPANDNRWQLQRCLLGVSYGSPMKLAVAAAAGLRRAFDSRSVCVYGAGQVGLGGTRASLGSAVTFGNFGSAVGVSGGMLRTFGSPGGDALRWRNYVGGSVHLWPLLAIHTELGAYSLVTRGGESSQQLFTWSVGFGY